MEVLCSHVALLFLDNLFSVETTTKGLLAEHGSYLCCSHWQPLWTLNTYSIQEKRCDPHESWRQTASQKRKTICWLHQSFSLCLFTDKQIFYSWRTAFAKATNILQPARCHVSLFVKEFGPGLHTSNICMDRSKYLMYKEHRIIIQNLLFLPQD